MNRSVRNKAAKWVFEALEHLTSVFPLPIIGIDSDNGSEFINAHLLAYCEEREITFTRSRPGNKNDGAHVEQKNWASVRELVGYLHYDTPAELELLNEILGAGSDVHQLLTAPTKARLQATPRSKATKKHDKTYHPAPTGYRPSSSAQTPNHHHGPAIKRTYPAAHQGQILALAGRLEELSLAKKLRRSKPVIATAKQGRTIHEPETHFCGKRFTPAKGYSMRQRTLLPDAFYMWQR